MQYRELGRTGLIVSEIGLGCEGFAGKDEPFTQKLFQLALSCGINCMDLYSPDPDLRDRVGRALRGKRESFLIQGHLCTVWRDGQYQATRNPIEVDASFRDLLERLETDYVDIGMLHYVDSSRTWQEMADNGILDYAKKQKNAGKIHSLGLSSHNPEAALEAVESGIIDVLMFSINPCYDLLPGEEDCERLWAKESYASHLVNPDPAREKLYETCQRLGVGITVMKAFGGGELLRDSSPAGKSLTVNQCIHYALTRPAVATVFAGVHSMEELQTCLAYETASDTEKDYASAFAAFPKISWQGHCMYCGHCAPCSQEIDIALITKFLNLVKTQDSIPETVREHYAALPVKADACVSCGQCETRCPFGVLIRDNMKQAQIRFAR